MDVRPQGPVAEQPWRRARWALVPVVGLIAGCAAHVRETHYFALEQAGTSGERVASNYFRLTVAADVRFSNARYVAGFYDPRAVDLFFSELKPTSPQPLFAANLTEPGTATVLKPLSPGDSGSYVMVLSTNADAIAEAIGAFSESEVVGRSIASLIHHDTLLDKQRSDAGAAPVKAMAAATTAELTATLEEAAAAKTAGDAETGYLKAINVVAREMGVAKDFAKLSEARAWIEAQRGAVR